MKDNKNIIIIIFIVLLVIGIIVGLVLYYKGRQKYSQITSYKPYRNEMLLRNETSYKPYRNEMPLRNEVASQVSQLENQKFAIAVKKNSLRLGVSADIVACPQFNVLNNNYYDTKCATFCWYLVALAYSLNGQAENNPNLRYKEDKSNDQNAINFLTEQLKQSIPPNYRYRVDRLLSFHCSLLGGKSVDTFGGFVLELYENESDNRPMIFVAVRGTVQPCEWQEDITASLAHPSWLTQPEFQNVKVHNGFNRIYTNGDASNGTRTALASYFTEKENARTARRVFVTGHSLGGGVANLITTDLSANFPYLRSIAKVFTLAAPFTGNQDFANLINRNGTNNYSGLFSIINTRDWVPTAGLTWFGYVRPAYQNFYFTASRNVGYNVQASSYLSADAHLMPTYKLGITKSRFYFDYAKVRSLTYYCGADLGVNLTNFGRCSAEQCTTIQGGTYTEEGLPPLPFNPEGPSRPSPGDEKVWTFYPISAINLYPKVELSLDNSGRFYIKAFRQDGSVYENGKSELSSEFLNWFGNVLIYDTGIAKPQRYVFEGDTLTDASIGYDSQDPSRSWKSNGVPTLPQIISGPKPTSPPTAPPRVPFPINGTFNFNYNGQNCDLVMEGTSGYIMCYNYMNSGQNENVGSVIETEKISNDAGYIIATFTGLFENMIFYIENNQLIDVNGKDPREMVILRGQWNFQSDGTQFRLNLNGDPSKNYGSLLINGFIPVEVSETVFLNNLYNVKIDGGEIKINTDFQVIDITFYPSNSPLKILAGRNFKPKNADRVRESEFWDDSRLN